MIAIEILGIVWLYLLSGCVTAGFVFGGEDCRADLFEIVACILIWWFVAGLALGDNLRGWSGRNRKSYNELADRVEKIEGFLNI